MIFIGYWMMLFTSVLAIRRGFDYNDFIVCAFMLLLFANGVFEREIDMQAESVLKEIEAIG